MSIQSKLQSHLLTKLVNFRWVEKRLPQLLVIVLEQKVRAKEHSYQVREKIIIIGKQLISLISVLKRIKATLQHTVNFRLWGSPVIDPTASKQKNSSDDNPHGIKHPPLAFNVMNSICDEVLKLEKSTVIPVLSGHGIKLTASIKRKVAKVPKFIFPIYFKWNLY